MKTSWFLMAIGLSVPVLGDEPGVVGRRPYELEGAWIDFTVRGDG